MERRNLVGAVIAVLASALAQAAGAEEVRSVPPFTSLAVDAPVNVTLQAAAADRVVLEGDPSALARIETRVEQGVLRISTPGSGWRSGADGVRVRVEFKTLDAVRLAGSGNVRADLLKTATLKLTTAGSGNIDLGQIEVQNLAVSVAGSGNVRVDAGTIDLAAIVIAGSGNVRIDRVPVREVAVNVAGSGNAWVNATETLKVRIAGSGDVRYRGSPRLEQQVVGSGDVAPLR
jgi:hypothetical protein